ncbi:MAG: nicotinate-nucleotide adenylyltransferase [Anaerolineae bacterium]
MIASEGIGSKRTGGLGVLGGTFDPIHLGHLIVAEEVRCRLGLEAVLFVPARVSPLKLGGGQAGAEHRVRMVELAIADNSSFRLSRVDMDREGPSYTIDTLQALRADLPSAMALHFILGADTLQSLHDWRAPQQIIRLCRIAAMHRPGYPIDWEALERQVPGIREATDVIESIQVGISATDIRARLQRGETARYLLPGPVSAYIREHGLYRADSAMPQRTFCPHERAVG